VWCGNLCELGLEGMDDVLGVGAGDGDCDVPIGYACEAVPATVERVEDRAHEIVEGLCLGLVGDLAVHDAEMTATPGELLGFLDQKLVESPIAFADSPAASPGVVGSYLVETEGERVVVLHSGAPIAPSLHETVLRRHAGGALPRTLPGVAVPR
jgi:hypothetical protein